MAGRWTSWVGAFERIPVQAGASPVRACSQLANQPNAARKLLGRLDPEHDLDWMVSDDEVGSRYWSYLAASWHMVGGYRAELEITERWRDSTEPGVAGGSRPSARRARP